MSLRPSTLSPASCSGLMNSGVPTTSPVLVTLWLSSPPTALAMPKSTTFTTSRPSRRRERALPLHHSGERLSLDEFHREVDDAVARLAEVVDRADVGMGDSTRVRRFAIEARHGIRVVHQGRIHHLDSAAPAHLHVLGEVHPTHPALTELLQDVVAIGDNLADEIGRGRRGPQRLPVVGAELHVVRVLGRADGADLHASVAGGTAGSSTRSSLSPTRRRDSWRSGTSPRAATATPFRLSASITTKS